MQKNYSEEYIAINGIEQFLLHYPKAPGTPVLLYLHGGPGNFESLFAYTLDEQWGDSITHVHWDQRGAGKTQRRNKKAGHPESIEQMLEDVNGVVEHLKEVYQTDKIIILGHSWGSLLGSLYVQRHPANIKAYIGTGQVINMMENERIGFQQVLKMAEKAGNQKHIKQLEQLGDYPPKDPEELMKVLIKVRKVQSKYEENGSITDFLKSMAGSPSFQWGDIISFLRAMKVNRQLVLQAFAFDLRKYPTHYEVPVHYILGEQDTTTPTAIAQSYFDAVDAPSKSITVLPHTGHNPMYDLPKAFADALLAICQTFA